MAWNRRKNFKIKLDEKKKTLTITLALEDPPYPSKSSGRTMVIASTHGVLRTDLVVNDKNIRVVVNAFYPMYTNKRCNAHAGSGSRVSGKGSSFYPNNKAEIEGLTKQLRDLVDSYDHETTRDEQKRIRNRLRRLGFTGGTNM